VGFAYGTDIDKLETVARSVLKQNPRILAQPPPVLGISAFGDSEIVYAIKPWVRVDDYVAAQTEIHRAVVQAFATSEIEMPFPQREVRILNNGTDPLQKKKLWDTPSSH
jgi:small conductance mechanosensitive channel